MILDNWEQVGSVCLLPIAVVAHVVGDKPPQGVARLNRFSLIELAPGVVCAGDSIILDEAALGSSIIFDARARLILDARKLAPSLSERVGPGNALDAESGKERS